jgi:hypothetical protein
MFANAKTEAVLMAFVDRYANVLMSHPFYALRKKNKIVSFAEN